MPRITGIIRQGSLVDQKYCNDGIKLSRMVGGPLYRYDLRYNIIINTSYIKYYLEKRDRDFERDCSEELVRNNV